MPHVHKQCDTLRYQSLSPMSIDRLQSPSRHQISIFQDSRPPQALYIGSSKMSQQLRQSLQYTLPPTSRPCTYTHATLSPSKRMSRQRIHPTGLFYHCSITNRARRPWLTVFPIRTLCRIPFLKLSTTDTFDSSAANDLHTDVS